MNSSPVGVLVYEQGSAQLVDKRLIRLGVRAHTADHRWVKRWNNLRVVDLGREHPLSRLEVAMKPWLKWTGLILLAAVIGLAQAFAFTAAVKPQRGNAPITFDQAVESARQYLTSYGNPDLVLTEIMEFSDNFYAEVEEKSTGIHAFELLINRHTGAVSPEPGPNMRWKTRYGHMGGMMGDWGGRQNQVMVTTPERAREIAQGWLDKLR